MISSIVQLLTNLGQHKVLTQKIADPGLHYNKLTKVGSVGVGTRICFLQQIFMVSSYTRSKKFENYFCTQ